MNIKKPLKKIAFHVLIIFIVIIIPPIVYDYMASYQYYDFALIGGISYFIYAFYLVFKIKNQRVKIILLGILYSIITLCIGTSLMFINDYSILILLTINLIIQYFLLAKNPKSIDPTIGKSYLISFVITIILSLFGVCFWSLMLAAGGMPSNHY